VGKVCIPFILSILIYLRY